ncbi:MAG: hypothetical protein ACK4I0_06230 [Brevundimonas sp.]|uniref:hypothetical protein n=1 Tax=Brevundimonas sp. TaxID=1871086 RepID=UPI0039190DDF
MSLRRLWKRQAAGSTVRDEPTDLSEDCSSEATRDGLLASYFDADFYLSKYRDVARAGVDPMKHWLNHGCREGRWPAPWFDPAAYRAQFGLTNQDDPLTHLLALDAARADAMRTAWTRTETPDPQPTTETPILPLYGLARQPGSTEAIVFTAISGERHALTNNTTQWPDMRLYNDAGLDVKGWRLIPSLYWDANPKLAVLFHKYCLASLMPEGSKIIWIDSRVSVQRHALEEISATLDHSDICAFAHYERDCVYDELDAIIRGNRASADEVAEFRNHLTEQEFERSGGLMETGAIGFRATPETARVLRRAFGLARRFIARDQVTLPLALKHSALKVSLFNGGQTHLRNTPGVVVNSW